MRSFVCKIGLVILAAPAFVLAGPAGPPSGQSILNSPIYQRNSQTWIDTITVQGILQIPHGSATPPASQCTVSSQTGRIFIVSSTTAGGARIYVCEGTNGWQIKTSTGGSGGSGNPGGLNTQFQYNNSGSFAGSSNLTTDGSTITATRFSASTMTISSQATFLGVGLTTWNSVSTVTVNDGVLWDMSGINDSNNGEGLLIPQTTDCSNSTRNGSLCWDTDDKILYVGNGTSITNAMAIGLSVLNGTVIVSSPTKTLNFNSSQFSVTAPVSSTASVALNGSSVTLKGSLMSQWMTPQQFTTTTSSATSTNVFQNTNLQVTVTPKSSTSKVWVTVNFEVSIGAGSTASFTLTRNGTNILAAGDGFWRGAANYAGHVSYSYIDTPGSATAQIYILQFKAGGGGVTIEANNETGAIIAQDIIP